MSEQREWKSVWTLQGLRKSTPGDPTDENGPSRFIFNEGPEEAMREQYEGYAQPTEVILAELRDETGRVVARFDRIAEVMKEVYEWTASLADDAEAAIACAARGEYQ